MDRAQALRFFKATNVERIRRLVELSPVKQSPLFHVLPLLFHVNSKGLPGYINDETPFGIVDYRPEQESLDRAKQLDSNFQFKQKALRHYALRGIYLINRHGLLHTPKHAEYDLWLITHEGLTKAEIQALQQKLNSVIQWANELDVKLHTKIIDETEIQNSLTAEEIEEFYTTGLILAGCVPYWWLIAPEDEVHYDLAMANLEDHRMLTQATFIDFGKVEKPKPRDLFLAAYQSAMDALQEDVVAILDLLYWQQVLTHEDSIQPLSLLFKQKTYLQQLDILADLNLLKLEVIEKMASPETILFARQSFYHLSHERLSRSVLQPTHPWRRTFMQEKVEQWEWSDQVLQQLDHLDENFQQAEQLFISLSNEFNTFILLLTHFANQHDINARSHLQKLKQQYQLRFHPSADVIASLPLSLRPKTLNQRVYLYRFKDTHSWVLSLQSIESPSQTALFKHENLLHTLSWAVANQILTRSDWLSVTDQHQILTTSAVVTLAQQLLRSSLAEDDLILDENTSTKIEPEELLLFVNIEEQPSSKLMQQGLHLTSRQNDPLCYSSFRQSVVKTIDGLIKDNNQQWHSFSYTGELAVLESIAETLRWQPTEKLSEHTSIWCHTPTFAQLIIQRLNDLFFDCWHFYQRHPVQGRILLNIAEHRYALSWKKNQTEVQQHADNKDIWWALSLNRSEHIPVLLDQQLDTDGLFNTLLSYQEAHKLSVFIYAEHNTVISYVVDEAGNLTKQQYQYLTEATVITHLRRFLAELKSINQIVQIRFFRLSRFNGEWHLNAVAAPTGTKSYLPVHVIMSSPDAKAKTIVQCGQQIFQGYVNEPNVFDEVRNLVFSLRNQRQHYPVYLETLHFETESYYPANVYLQYKQQLESALNAK